MTENPFDKACRYLIKLDPAPLLAWLLGLTPEAFQFVRWIDTRRLPFPGRPDRTCDTVAHLERLDDNHRPWALVVEFNIEPDPVMFGRLLGYLGPLWIEEKPSSERGDRFELGTVIVNLTSNAATSRRSEWPDAGIESVLTIRERNLAGFDASLILQDIAAGAAPMALLAWVPLMQNSGEAGIIERWKEIAATEPSSRRRSEYAALAKIFAEAADRQGIWRTSLKEWNMRESKVVKEWQDEGRVEGRLERSIETVLDVLQDKFGTVPPELPAHLQSITDATFLRQLVLKAVHAGSLNEFQKHLPNGTK